jgi:hypothetical protein
MKRIQNLIIFFLCLCVVGFFANFAQNDYGLAIVRYAMLIIGVLMLELLRHTIIEYKKLGYSLYIMIFFPVLSMFIYVYDKGDTYFIVSSIALFFGYLHNLILVPLVIYFKERKTRTPKVNFRNYFELIFLCLIPIAIYLKANYLIGGGILLGTSMLIVIPYLFSIVKVLRAFAVNKSSLHVFQTLAYLFISLSVLGTVFKQQHWPGANSISPIALSFLFFSILMALYQKLFKKEKGNLFESMQSITKIVFVTFCVTGLWLSLKMIDLAPAVYSDDDPTAMQLLKANANDFTAEGKEYKRRHIIYEKNIDKFVHERNTEQIK